MVPAEDGFAYPRIDDGKCVACGLCRRACPELSGLAWNTRPQECRAVMASDELRAVSSSGGVFSVLAKKWLEEGGVVYGAAFGEALTLRHTRADSWEGIAPLRGSKYLQSAIGDAYRRVREDLRSGRQVMFVGTPCQIAGLRGFMGRDEERLFLVDLICHGVPSQALFDAYLREYDAADPVVDYEFRNKRDGWGAGYLLRLRTRSGRQIYKTDSEDAYMRAFFAGLDLRESCYGCRYTGMQRVSDLTLADFWGVAESDTDGRGTSMILLNTDKARALWNRIAPGLKLDRVYDASIAEMAQPQLRHPSGAHPRRAIFLNEVRQFGFSEAVNRNMCHDRSVAILNFHWENVNFGAVLTAFALNRYLNASGYSAQNIDYVPAFPWIAEEAVNTRFDAFRSKYLPCTKRVAAGEDLSFLNECFRNFIVGSDQVWRPEFIAREKNAFMLAFAADDKNLISCAASFGTDSLGLSAREEKEYAIRLSRFDHISVREASGVEICRRMGLAATQIVDPVFLLDQKDWCALADSYTGGDATDIVYYTIDDDKDRAFVEYIGSGARNLTWDVDVEEWLWRIRNAKLLVTDSFHGSCFAILFNRPFICINPNLRTQTRMRSLFEQLGIRNHLYSDFSEVKLSEAFQLPVDYAAVNQRLAVLREEARRFLNESLAGVRLSAAEKHAAGLALCRHLLKGLRWRIVSKRLHRVRYGLMEKLTHGRRRDKYARKLAEARQAIKRMKGIWRTCSHAIQQG